MFPDVGNLQPRSADRLTTLSLRSIRDLARQIHFSFLGSVCNLADSSTKVLGNRKLFHRICISREFVISFARRQKLKLQRADASEQEKTDTKLTSRKFSGGKAASPPP